MTKKAATAVAVLAAAALCSCGAPSVKHGTVVSKEYVPARHWTYMQPIRSEHCVRVGKVEDCRTYTSGYIPFPEADPACWKLHLEDAGGHKGSVCVSESAWNAARVGGTW